MVSTLYASVGSSGNPIIAGDQATFVWHGEKAPALVGDFTQWQSQPVSLDLDTPGLWSATLSFPRDAYIEYTFWSNGKPVRDPLNVRTSPNGFGGQNHYFYMPDAAPTPLREHQRGVPVGKLHRQVLKDDVFLAGGERGVTFYQPRVSEPSPLIVVFDGQDYLEKCSLPTIVDNLIHNGKIRPVALAMMESRPDARVVEYACSDATLAFLQRTLLPAARERCNLLDPEDHPGAYGVMGASAGALMAMYTALRMPEWFGLALCQSGVYRLEARNTVVWDLIKNKQTITKIWMDVGLYDARLDENNEMDAYLTRLGISHGYRVFPAGHNYPAWRDDLSRGLEALFGL